MKIERYEQVWEAFLIPTIKFVYTTDLLGHYSLDFVWLRWGFSISWGHKK